MKKCDILIAHPHKHHVLNLVAGCCLTQYKVFYITPLYKKGLIKFLELFQGKIGKKMTGYFHPGIPLNNILIPPKLLIRKLLSLSNLNNSFESEFDQYVANLIANEKLKAKAIVTLQDYMPKTVAAAKSKNFLIWSDQISNQSVQAQARINKHALELNQKPFQHNEQNNTNIIISSDFITVPSQYTYQGISDRVLANTKVCFVPYGVDNKKFVPKNLNNKINIKIVARANSYRKGGGLLVSALQHAHEAISHALNEATLEIKFLGALDPFLKKSLSLINFSQKIKFTDRNYAHSEVPELLSDASYFLMPALSESMSLACIEAMQMGVPLIITPYVGVDAFEAPSMGYLINDNATELADTLIKAIKEISEAPEKGQRCQAVAKLLTMQNYEKKISDCLRELLDV